EEASIQNDQNPADQNSTVFEKVAQLFSGKSQMLDATLARNMVSSLFPIPSVLSQQQQPNCVNRLSDSLQTGSNDPNSPCITPFFGDSVQAEPCNPLSPCNSTYMTPCTKDNEKAKN